MRASGSVRRRLRRAAGVLENAAFAGWIGAMAGFAFIFAPTAFHRIGNRELFAALIGETIGRLDGFGFGCGALALLAGAADPARSARLRQGCAAAMLAGTAFEHWRVLPTMAGMSAAADPDAYARLHRLSSSVYAAVLLAGVAALALRAARALPPEGPAVGDAAAAGAHQA